MEYSCICKGLSIFWTLVGMKYYYIAAVTYVNICATTGLLLFSFFLSLMLWSLTTLDDISLDAPCVEKRAVFSFTFFCYVSSSQSVYSVTVTTMDLGHKFQDLEETGETLVALINSAQTEKLREIKHNHLALFDQHIETKKIVTQILKGK